MTTILAAAPRRRRSLDRRAIAVIGVLLVALALAAVASLALGVRAIDLAAVWSGLTTPASTSDAIVVRDLRLPRTIIGALVGAALGAAGALAQGHTRNPLADPGLLGVSAGAALAVVTAIHLGGITSASGYVWFALLGALIASVLVFGLGASGRGGGSPLTLALVGAAVTATLGGITTAIVLSDEQTLDAFRFWTVGSIAGRDSEILAQTAPFLIVGLVLALVHARSLDTASLGADVARSLGQDLRVVRGAGVLSVTILTGAAVAAAGPIGFVGLVVPHAARFIVGPDHRRLVPVAALLGAVLLLVADVVGRLVAQPGELQVGIVLALIGAPVFIAVVRGLAPAGRSRS